MYDDLDDDNYDIIIDQRQNGTQNFRIRVNGLNVALPADEVPEESSQISQDELASLLGISTSAQPSSSLSSSSLLSSLSDKNDFADFAAFFEWKKSVKSNGNKKTLSDTQSRTKDIPTNSQLNKKGEGKKYKLLVGEKYIIPLIQFLKKQADSVE